MKLRVRSRVRLRSRVRSRSGLRAGVLFLFPVIILFLLTGCSKLEKDITQPSPLTVHKEGILDPMDADWHGNLVRNNHWEMRDCKQCHGSNYAGGIAEQSCISCHNSPTGPENCSTCHGSSTSPAPPRDLNGNTAVTDRAVGAHQVHLAEGISCAECHQVPSTVYEQGHVDTEGPAEVMMNSFMANIKTNEPGTAEYKSQQPLFTPDPVYNFTSGSCANTYCHGSFKNGNTGNSPNWSDPNSAACGTCHGDITKATLADKSLPKTEAEGGTHYNIKTCSGCHGGVVDVNLKFINPSKHIDGKLNLFGEDIDF